MEVFCLACNEKIKGRVDKKFCSDACRNMYNNSKNKDSTNLMRNTNNLLRKNYRILCELNRLGKTKLAKQKLVEKSFSFDYCTQVKIYKNENIYYFVYDQGYRFLENDLILLVEKQSEI